MAWTATVEGLDDLERDWGDALTALSDGARRGVARGVEEGAAEARTVHRYTDRTGALTASVKGRVETSTKGGAEGVIEATMPYASFVEEGTQPHDIRPVRAKALHWTDGDGEHFAAVVHHPGGRSFPFMGPALQKAERVIVAEVEIAEVTAARIMERE